MDKALTYEPKKNEKRVLKEIFDMFIAIHGKRVTMRLNVRESPINSTECRILEGQQMGL